MTLTKENEQDFIDAFGRALLSWQQVEMQLFFTFKALIRAKDDRVTSAAYHSIMNLNTKLGMINEAALIALDGKPLLAEWKALQKVVKKESKNRNELAHLTVGANTTGIKTTLVLKPSIFDVRDAKYREYDLLDIRRFEKSFKQLSSDLDAFWVKISMVLH